MCFFFSFNPKITKWNDVMYIKSLSVFFGRHSATLANFVALAGEFSLSSPRFTVIPIIPAFVAWMKIAGSVFRLPFTHTLCRTKEMFSFSTISPTFTRNWFPAIRTWWTAFSSFFNRSLSTQYSAALIRTRINVFSKRRSANKFFMTNNAYFCNGAAIVTKLCVRLTVKFITAFLAFTNGFFATWHNALYKGVPRLASQYCCHAIQAKRGTYKTNKNLTYCIA